MEDEDQGNDGAGPSLASGRLLRLHVHEAAPMTRLNQTRSSAHIPEGLGHQDRSL